MATAVLVLSGLLGLGFLSTRLAEWARIPHSVLLVLLGVGAGAIYRTTAQTIPDELWASFPELVLFVLLPPLIFESAYHLDLSDLKRDIVPVMGLAVVGLLLSALLVGWGLTWVGFPPQAAFLFGALISATDPVAVVALFRKLGAPHRLALLTEAESLLNDGTAIVLFRVILAGAVGLGAGLADFFVVVLGGALVGVSLIVVAKVLFLITRRSGVAQVGLTVVAAYGSFIVADHFFHVSGVIATMVVGLYMGEQARLNLNRHALGSMQSLWELLALSANTLIFLAVGLSADIPSLVQYERSHVLFALALVLVGRAASVSLVTGLCNKLKLSAPIPLAYQAVLCWGGLRGGLALALALIVPVDFPFRQELLTLSIAVVLFSLMVNALTTGPLVRWLKLDELSDQEEAFYVRNLARVFRKVFAALSPGVKRGALSEKLLAQLEEGSLGSLSSRDLSQAGEEVSIQQLLLAERQHYNRKLELGVLSPRAYSALVHLVEERLDLYSQGGLPAAADFSLEPVEGSQLGELAYELEILLNLDLALGAEGRLEDLDTGVHDVLIRWIDMCGDRLQQFYIAYPNLSLGVQSMFIARTLAAAGETSLDELMEARVIKAPVYARALDRLEQLRGSLIRQSERLLRPSFRTLLQEMPLLEGLPAEWLDRLEKATRFVRFKAGQAVFHSGAPAHSIFLVFNGVLEVRGNIPGEAPRLFPGSFFGELGVLLDRPRSATVVALVESELAELHRDLLSELMGCYPRIREEILAIAQQRQPAEPPALDRLFETPEPIGEPVRD